MKKVYLCVLLIMLSLPLMGCGTGKTPSARGEPGVSNLSDKQVDLIIRQAEINLNKGDARLALNSLLSIRRQADHLPVFHMDLGRTYLALNEYENAVKSFERAVDLKSDYAEALNYLGTAYDLAGRPDKAVGAFHRALEVETYLTPEFPAFNLAWFYLSQNDTEKAKEYAKLAIQKNWRFTQAYVLLADIYNREGNPDEALDWLKSGAEADPSDTQLLLRLAETLMRKGQNREAKTWLNRIIEQDPKSNAAQAARDYLELLP